MDLPAFLPQELAHYGKAEDDTQLFSALKNKPADLIHFFDYVCDDETWSGVSHPQFTRDAIQWLTEQAHHDHLDLDSIYDIANNLHTHYDNLSTLIIHDLTILLEDGEQKTNSLLFQASSEYLRTAYRSECLRMEKPKLKLEINPFMFEQINEFILRGDHQHLWKYPPDVLFKLLTITRKLELEQLGLITEDVIKRYIDNQNVFEFLEKAQNERWPHLRNCCFEYINRMESDVVLIPDQLNTFRFEFNRYSDDALKIFDKVKILITQLIIRNRLTDDPLFPKIINECPRLNSLDMSDTTQYTEYLKEIPQNLQELVLVGCSWLNHQNLQEILSHCTKIQKLHLNSNTHLNINTWVALSQSPSLIFLSLARCTQIKDDDLKVIVQAVTNLAEINLEGCTGISDHGFTELARRVPELVIANLTKTNIGDGALAEMLLHSKRLISLNLSRCSRISPKGILTLIRGVPSLQILNITGCGFSNDTIRDIKKARPLLTVVR